MDQDGAVRLGDLENGPANLLHGGAFADQVAEVLLGLDLILEVVVLALQLGLQARDLRPQLAKRPFLRMGFGERRHDRILETNPIGDAESLYRGGRPLHRS